MGFPRRGCSTCKKRRVGCDSVRPVCGRCQKASRDCIWDPRDESGWRFENENAFAGGRLRRPRGAKKTSSNAPGLEISSPTKVPPTLSVPVSQQAVTFWMVNFTFNPEDLPDIGHDFSVHVPAHLKSLDIESSMSLALSACSHAVFGRLKKVDHALAEGERFYAQSIIKTQEEMRKQLSSSALDQLLITIMLMANYENTTYGMKRRYVYDIAPSITNEVGSRIWRTVCHHKGASGLMNLSQKLERTPNLALHRAIRRQVMKTCILRGRHVPPWIEDGSKYGENGHMLELDSIMIRVAALREASMPLFHEKDPDTSAWIHFLKSILTDAQELEIALTDWARPSSEDWKFSTYPAPPDSDISVGIDGPTTPSHTYTTHAHAAVWNHYRATRLIVNSIRLRAFTLLLDCPTQCSAIIGLQNLCQENVDILSMELCGSVPFFFQTSGLANGTANNKDLMITHDIQPKMAELLVWPLTVAVSTESVPNQQREWLRRVLKICAIASGNAVSASVAEQGEFRF